MDVTRKQISSLLCFVFLCICIGSAASVRLTVTPTSKNVLLGDQVQFLCSYTPDFGASCDDTFVFWGKKGGNTLANMTYVIDTSKYGIIWRSRVNNDGSMRCLYTLVVKDITDADGGQYSCALIRPQSGHYFIAQALARLQPVIPPPEIYPICRTSVITGRSLSDGMTLVCESTIGQPTVSLEWTAGEYELPSELHKLNNNLLQLETTMTLVDVSQLRDPLITCIMKLPDPIKDIRTCSINTSTTVAVRSESSTEATTAIATFVCHVATSVPYEIDWYFRDRLINAHDPHDRFFAETEAQALHIRDVTDKDEGGVVTCRVATMFGNFTGTAVLDVSNSNRKTLTLDGGTMALILSLVIVGLLALLVLNIVVWCKCKRKFASSHSAKGAPELGEECTPMSPAPSPPPSKADREKAKVVTETETRSESQYLDMSKPVRKVATTNNADYSPMKSLEKTADDEDYLVPTKDNGDDDGGEYMVSSKSDDPSTYIHSSTNALNKINGKTSPKSAHQSKPIKLQEGISTPTKGKSSPEQNSEQNAGIKAFTKQISIPALIDDDADDYEVLAKDVEQSPNKPKLQKMSSEATCAGSPTNGAKASPKSPRNPSAPLLATDQPEYAYAITKDKPEMATQKSGSSSTKAPVYDIPNDNSQKTSNINHRINNFEKAAEKSSSPLLKHARRPPVLQKNLQRHSDPLSSSDGEPSPRRTPGMNRTSLAQADSSNQYLAPSVSQQSLDKIKPTTTTTTPVKEGKSPLPKKVKFPFKPKNNNKDTYQCLDRQSRELEHPGYQVLLGMKKVDDATLYENVCTGEAV